ncbi:DUF167 domain-containing protein [Ideonella sp. DXS29W]|uniref:UPF0235 protein AACH06_14010 n=1 Tax=Ideonella lacteola TaxID=2984193 RepID=A0ABU9BQA5_9BURK
MTEDSSPRWPCVRAAGSDACILTVSVQPNARHTELVGLQEGALRLKLAAPPIDGQANVALAAWLAKELGLPKRSVQLRRGAAARHKQLDIDTAASAVCAWLDQRLGAPPSPSR